MVLQRQLTKVSFFFFAYPIFILKIKNLFWLSRFFHRFICPGAHAPVMMVRGTAVAVRRPVLRALGARPGPSPDFRQCPRHLHLHQSPSNKDLRVAPKACSSPKTFLLSSSASPSTQPLDWKPKLCLVSPPCLIYFQVSASSIPIYLMELLPLCGAPPSLAWISAAVSTLVSLVESGLSLVPVRSILHKAARVFLFFFFFLAILAKVLIFLINFYWNIVYLQCWLVSAAQQSESVIHIHISTLF